MSLLTIDALLAKNRGPSAISFADNARYIFFFLLDFGLSGLTSLQLIQYHVAGFYKPTIPQSPPSHEWCLKNGLHSGVLNPRPLGHESSALTTRPQLLARYILSCKFGIILPCRQIVAL